MTPPLLRLKPRLLEKIWGARNVAPWFQPRDGKIGEAWYEREDGARLPLLVKLIFTSERLSVQVHPGNEHKLLAGEEPKTEMWHILAAEPGASIAMGFTRELTAEQLRRAAETGEIEGLLAWIPVKPGDTYFIPAGTVHAIGGGLALLEVQQPSDTTFRLYDYGRPRELHLDRSMEVARRGLYTYNQAPVTLTDGWTRLVRCPYFETQLWAGPSAIELDADGREEIVVAVEGEGRIDAEAYRPGDAFLLRGSCRVEPFTPSRLVRTFVPEEGACGPL